MDRPPRRVNATAMDRPAPRGLIAPAEDRWWNVFFGIVAVGVTAAVLAETSTSFARRLVGAGSIVVITILYGLWGQRLVGLDRVRAGLAFVAVMVLAFGVGTYAITSVSYLLFAVSPAIFLVLPLRPAIPAVIVASLTPLLVALPQDPRAILHLGPIFAVSAAIAVWLGVFINQVVDQSAERATLITELQDTRTENARLAHEAGVAAERERLAGEIHDTLAQGFTSIITLLQAADPALSDERLALAVRTARENLAESRTLIAALAPSVLASGSLLDAVRRESARFTEETSIPVTCRLTGEPRPLPTATQVVLLRAAQEALTNVRRHASAHEVAVLLAYGADTVRLVIRDDGRGFDVSAAGGFGLRNMRARAEQVHGTLAVRSDPDTATTIELEVPA
jgi:signal transduction histidine kinase